MSKIKYIFLHLNLEKTGNLCYIISITYKLIKCLSGEYDMAKTIKVIIADENADLRAALQMAIDGKSGIKVVDSVENGRTLIDSILAHQPDFVLLDHMLPVMDGISAVRNISRQTVVNVPVFCILTGFASAVSMNEAMKAGVAAYLMNPIDSSVLEEKIVELMDSYNMTLNSVPAGVDAETQLEILVTNTIHEIGVPAHIKGYQYIRDAIIMTINDMDTINAVTKVMYPAIAKKGNIVLGGKNAKPIYSNFKWGAMIFTSTMAADILYWSLTEWIYYYNANPEGAEVLSMYERQKNASTYTLFHWGPIPWSFYILPAVAYAYKFYVKNQKKESLSDACKPLLGEKTDGIVGKIIDIIAVVGLIAGTATTFSLATPLMGRALSEVFGFEQNTVLTIAILVFIGVIFTIAVLSGMKAISYLAVACVAVFVVLAGIFLLFGPKAYMLESGLAGIGRMLQNFLEMSTATDPLRVTGDGITGFPQDWTIFYWAYWIAWFVATPFFIAKISEGRTIRQTILGGYISGLLGTYTSFLLFGNFGLYQQTSGRVDAAGAMAAGISVEDIVIEIFNQLPVSKLALLVLVVAMVAFYSSTFDAITLVMAGFSMKEKNSEEPPKFLRAFWAMVFLIFPIALIWSDSTLSMLQTISIIAAFPLGVIIIIIVAGFMKDLKQYKKE